MRLLLVLLLLLSPLSYGAQHEVAFSRLSADVPAIGEMAAAARRRHVTFGIFGGVVRDVYLGRPFSPISDIDVIYDSSEAGFEEFREEISAIFERNKGKIPEPDFHFDLSKKVRDSERREQLHGEGITATKVGVMCDERVLDPTGSGVRDLLAHQFRFFSPEPRKFLALENLGRFVRDLVRLHAFEREPATLELMRASLGRHSDPATPEGRKAIASAARCRALAAAGQPVAFRTLIRPFRKDLRYLHDGQTERLTDCFPSDVFLFELFKAITQADDMTTMREVLGNLGVDKYLTSVGFEVEARALMDPKLDRNALFDLFEFPGHAKAPAKPTILQSWETTLRRYNYRVLFDMLASEFPQSSAEATLLRKRRDAFLQKRSYDTLNPGDEYREELIGFLDTEFNDGKLPRERVLKSLDWFLSTYLPLGDATLVPIPARPNEVSPGIERGFSAEVRAISRTSPHSMADLPGYLQIQIGAELIPLLLDGRTVSGFLDCDQAEAARIVATHGYGQLFRVNACGYSRRRKTLLGYDQDHDCVCVAQYGFSSDEQNVNEQAKLWMLGQGEARAKPENVLVLRRPGAADFPDRAALEKLVNGLGRPVTFLLVGFANPLKRLLPNSRTERAGDLVLTIGDAPGSGGAEIALGLSAFGASYGSLPAKVAAALPALKGAALVGTAGGVSGVGERFAWVVPDRVCFAGTGVSGDKAPIAFDNRAGKLALPSAVHPALHATVATALGETTERVQHMKSLGVASVDCELYPFVASLAARKERVALYALLNVTDFPGGAGDEPARDGAISLENSGLQRQRVEEALRGLLEDYGRLRSAK